MKTTAMRINRVQLDFISADIRAVSVSIATKPANESQNATDEDLVSYQEQAGSSPDISRFTIPDNDFMWIDMDDFVEMDWILPAETRPETRIMPLAYSPRFTYFRQTDHRRNPALNGRISSSFGNEPTHFCIMSQDNDPQRVQCDLVRDRLAMIKEQIETHKHTLEEQELKVACDGPIDPTAKERYDDLQQQARVLEEKRDFMESLAARLSRGLSGEKDSKRPGEAISAHGTDSNLCLPSRESAAETESNCTQNADNNGQDFNNRFTVHNIKLKWNNSLRNVILRYAHQVSQRRGFVYYMSRRAVTLILDIIEEQRRQKTRRGSEQQTATPADTSRRASAIPEDGDLDVQQAIDELLSDGKAFVNAQDSEPDDRPSMHHPPRMGEDLAEDYTPQNT